MSNANALSSPIHINPRRLCHANLFVSDLKSSLEFYNRVCGLEIVLEQPKITAGFLSNGNTHHDIGMLQVTDAPVYGEGGHRILAAKQGATARLNHLGWEMESEFHLVQAYRRAMAAGYRTHRIVHHRASNSIYIFDPDGNIHEFYADTAKNWRDLYKDPTGQGASGEWDIESTKPSRERKFNMDAEIRTVEGAPLEPARFSHAVLHARNWESMNLFFSNVVGLYELARAEQDHIALYSSDHGTYPVTLALVRDTGESAEKKQGLHHMAFQVRDVEALDRAEKRLNEQGIEIVRRIDSDNKSSIFIQDPDNFLVEFCCHKAGWSPMAAMGDGFDTFNI